MIGDFSIFNLICSSLLLLSCGTTQFKSVTSQPLPLRVHSTTQLTKTNSFKLLIDQCESGYSRLITTNLKELQLYLGDRGCLGKLHSFTIGEEEFQEADGEAFHQYSQGESATFQSKPSNLLRSVVIRSQLTSPITKQSKIHYEISQVAESPDTGVLLGLKFGKTRRASSEDGKLQFHLKKSIFQGSNEDKRLTYSFTLECRKKLKSDPVIKCGQSKLEDISYKLIRGFLKASSCRKTEIAGCAEHFFGDEPTIDLNSDVIPAGENDLENGGFITSVLASPNPLRSKKWTLILKRGDTYRYYYIKLIDYSS